MGAPALARRSFRLGVSGTGDRDGVPDWGPIRYDSASPARIARGIRNQPLGAESLSWRRFALRERIRCRIAQEIRHPRRHPSRSGFQEPIGGPPRRAGDGVLGTGLGVQRTSATSGYWEPQDSGFQEPTDSGDWEPLPSGDREPRLTVYSEPIFVVTGTPRRGFRNQPPLKSQENQGASEFSTALNALTSFPNRVSSNGAAAENRGKTPPLGGFAPAGSLRRFAATPRALTRPPTRHPPIGVGLRPTSYSSSRWFL